MAEDIEREAALEAIRKPNVNPGGLIFDALKTACQEEVKHLPAADVQPVRRGKWVIKDVYPNCWIAACDQCGASYAVAVRVPFDEWTASDNRAYCGTCGAKMREDKA